MKRIRIKEKKRRKNFSFHVEAVVVIALASDSQREIRVSEDTINWHRSWKESSSSDSASGERIFVCVLKGGPVSEEEIRIEKPRKK